MSDREMGKVIHVQFRKRSVDTASIEYRIGLIRQAAGAFEARFGRVRRRVPRSHPLYWSPSAKGAGLEYHYVEEIQRILRTLRRELDSAMERLEQCRDTLLPGSPFFATIDCALDAAERKLETLEVFREHFETLYPEKSKTKPLKKSERLVQ